MQYQQAREIAIDILRKLEPFTHRIDFAGELAREENEVATIKIFCIPVKPPKGKVYSAFMRQAHNIGVCIDGEIKHSWAKYYLPSQDLKVEIFMPPVNLYYYRLVTHEAKQTFLDKVNELVKEKGNIPCETEYDFFKNLGIEWKPVKNRN